MCGCTGAHTRFLHPHPTAAASPATCANENQSPTHTTKCQVKSTSKDQDTICHMEIWYDRRQSLDPARLVIIYNPCKASIEGKKNKPTSRLAHSLASHLLREATRPALRTPIAVNGSLSPVLLQGTETRPVHFTVLQAPVEPEPCGQRRLFTGTRGRKGDGASVRAFSGWDTAILSLYLGRSWPGD